MTGTARRTEEELWKAFEVQRTALLLSAAAYDTGIKSEAVRMANAVFLLFGRGLRRHKSILDQLNLQGRIDFYTTVGHTGMQLFSVGVYVTIIPKNTFYLEAEHVGSFPLMNGRIIKFDEWWNEIVLCNDSGLGLSRCLLIRAMRDQDGGAHFDEELTDPAYIAAVRGELTGYTVQDRSGKSRPVPYALEASMRQIAEEVLRSLKIIRPDFRASPAAAPEPP